MAPTNRLAYRTGLFAITYTVLLLTTVVSAMYVLELLQGWLTRERMVPGRG